MRYRKSAHVVVALLVASIINIPAPVRAVQDPFCGDVQLVWARGTNIDVENDTQFAFVNNELDQRMGGAISYSSYQLGLEGGFGGFAYPANGGGLGFLLEWSDTLAGEYAASVAEGRSELVAWLTHRAAECPGEVFVLGGWSQGAQVMGEGLFLLNQAIRDRIAYVGLFGDPKFATGQVGIPFTDICYFEQQPWVRGTSECYSSGIFGARSPYLPSGIENRVGSWCRDGDLACTRILGDTMDQHFRYFDPDGDAAMAMREAAESLKNYIPDQANDLDASFLQFATGSAGADLVFVFDTTGSMVGEIEDAQAQATALAQLWLALSTNGRVALVEFRDQGDAFVSRIDLGLTNDVSAFQTAVNALEADEGGDIPEAQLSGIMTALNGLAWQDGATKIAIVITDAIGKDPEPVTGLTRVEVSQRALEIDPVAIYGVDVIDDAAVTAFLEPMAAATAGQVAALGEEQTLSDLLAEVMDSFAMSPVADLDGPYFALTGNPVHFQADGSFDPDANLVSFQWDFDGNGTTDQTTTSPNVDHTYPASFSGFAAVRVISEDGGEALATAPVTVDNVGLADDVALAPTGATASLAGAGQATITWTPTANDRADGYVITASGAPLNRFVAAGGANSITISGLDLNQPRTFTVSAINEFGPSAGVTTNPVGGGGGSSEAKVTTASTHYYPSPPHVTFGALGIATAASGVVSVDYRVWGVPTAGAPIVLGGWTPASPVDDLFNSTSEQFMFNGQVTDPGYTALDLEVRANGSASTSTKRVVIDREPPTSTVGALPTSTTSATITITASATDNGNATLSVSVKLCERYRSKTTNPWGAWTCPLTDPAGPYSWTYAFPKGKGYYEFYSIATDSSGNVESAPSVADAFIQKK